MSIEKRVPAPRSYISTSGTFAAVPQAFAGADGSLAYAFKAEFAAVPAAGDTSRTVLITPFDRALLDFGAVNLKDIDPAKIARDCELLGKVAQDNPEALHQIIGALGTNAGREERAAALATVKRLGLTEEAATQAGGGLLGFLLFAGAALLLSCSAHCKGGDDETNSPDK